MNIQDRFFEYAAAFEVSYEDDDWSRLAQYFTVQATYDSGDGDIAQDRDAVLIKLQGAVDGMDRRMDSREVDIGAPKTEGDTVILPWIARYTKAGLPDLEIAGTEYARFEGDRIASLRDELDAGTADTLNAWLSAHGAALSR